MRPMPGHLLAVCDTSFIHYRSVHCMTLPPLSFYYLSPRCISLPLENFEHFEFWWEILKHVVIIYDLSGANYWTQIRSFTETKNLLKQDYLSGSYSLIHLSGHVLVFASLSRESLRSSESAVDCGLTGQRTSKERYVQRKPLRSLTLTNRIKQIPNGNLQISRMTNSYKHSHPKV